MTKQSIFESNFSKIQFYYERAISTMKVIFPQMRNIAENIAELAKDASS
jgi:hypothetical protein